MSPSHKSLRWGSIDPKLGSIIHMFACNGERKTGSPHRSRHEALLPFESCARFSQSAQFVMGTGRETVTGWHAGSGREREDANVCADRRWSKTTRKTESGFLKYCLPDITGSTGSMVCPLLSPLRNDSSCRLYL